MQGGWRLAEVIGALSVASDLGKGLADGQALRTCTLAVELAERMDLPPADIEATFWVSLLRFVGCTATATEMGAALGDERAISAAFASADPRSIADVLSRAVRVTGRRPDRLALFLLRAPRVIRDHEVASCEVAELVADRLALPPGVGEALAQVFERWDGKGHPGAVSGAALAPAARVEQVARLVDLLRDEVDVANIKRLLRKQAGAALDPDVVAAFCNDADELATVGDGSFEQLLAAERHPHQLVDAAGIDEAMAVFGAVADMKSPYLTGHSRGVSHLASEAARCGGLPDADVVALRRAGLVHDIGRVAVSSVVWNKKGPLSGAEWELVSLHPHHTGRILARTPELAGITALAAAHHERSDGSGYPRSLSGPQLSPAASLLAAADVATGLAENRPHRPAVPPAQRVQTLRAEARAGRLTVPAVEAVLTALHEPTARLPRPDDRLTAREVEVLALVAGGATNRAVGSALGISPKTVNTHLEHINRKLGVSSRAAAVFYAVQAGHVDGSGLDAS